jgi:DNA primase
LVGQHKVVHVNIPESAIEEVRHRANIAEVAAELFELKRAGRSLVACCPFHQEKTPSFHVHEEEGYFKCFGCGKKGDVFALLMELRNWTFPEAVVFLANRYGVALPEAGSRPSPEREAGAQLRKVAAAVARVYSAFLAEPKIGKKARSYLEKRGIGSRTCEVFQLGYAPPQSELFLEAVVAQLTELSRESVVVELERLGVWRRGEAATTGRAFAFFRDRVIFPICRSDGCPIAFGGRVLEAVEGAPKYLNTPESPIYKKRRTLYGLSQASAALRQSRSALMVEGYTDVIGLQQAGIGNALASCGTSVTEEHAQVLRRVADSVTVVFDGDTAGRTAASRCFERFINSGVETQVVFLPEQEDPDSFVRRVGTAEFHKYLEANAQSAFLAYLEHSLEESNASGVAQTGKIAEKAMKLLRKVANPVEQELLSRQAADRLGVSVDGMRKLLGVRVAADARPTRDAPFDAQVVSQTQVPSRVVTQRVAAPTVVPGRKASMNAYVDQLVIAIVCEPHLVRGMAEISTLFSSAHLDAEVTSRVQQLIETVKRGEVPIGLASAYATGVVQEAGPAWRTLLSGLGLAERDLVGEAYRQVRIGGGKPQELLAEVEAVKARLSARDQLQVLRAKEAQAGDLERKLSIAQEKLRTKREMERLRSREEK